MQNAGLDESQAGIKIVGRNINNLRYADDTKRWQEYTEELHKKDLHDPDNHDGMIIHLEPDILECEVKWVLGSITMNKASEGEGILSPVLHRTGKGQFSFQSQRKAMPKNAQATAQLHSSHVLVK